MQRTKITSGTQVTKPLYNSIIQIPYIIYNNLDYYRIHTNEIRSKHCFISPLCHNIKGQLLKLADISTIYDMCLTARYDLYFIDFIIINIIGK